MKLEKVTPCLWFDGNAEDAAKFYVSLFKDSKVTNVSRYGDAGPGPKGSVMAVTFQLDGRDFMGLNGGPQFPFTEAVSFMVSCADQKEIDTLWAKLSANGGQEGPCGWLKDRFGVSWQIVPAELAEMASDKDARKADAVMQALLKMGKLEIQAMREAYEAVGRPKATAGRVRAR